MSKLDPRQTPSAYLRDVCEHHQYFELVEEILRVSYETNIIQDAEFAYPFAEGNFTEQRSAYRLQYGSRALWVPKECHRKNTAIVRVRDGGQVEGDYMIAAVDLEVSDV